MSESLETATRRLIDEAERIWYRFESEHKLSAFKRAIDLAQLALIRHDAATNERIADTSSLPD